MGISKELCATVKEYLSKMAYSHTEEDYLSVYDEFLKIAPLSVLRYFDANWHEIRKVIFKIMLIIYAKLLIISL